MGRRIYGVVLCAFRFGRRLEAAAPSATTTVSSATAPAATAAVTPSAAAPAAAVVTAAVVPVAAVVATAAAEEAVVADAGGARVGSLVFAVASGAATTEGICRQTDHHADRDHE